MPRWLSTISYPTRARGIIVIYHSDITSFSHIREQNMSLYCTIESHRVALCDRYDFERSRIFQKLEKEILENDIIEE